MGHGEAQVLLPRPTPRSGTPPTLFGMVVFLASELMLFAGLFAAYFSLRGRAAAWPPAGVNLDLPEPVAATAVLVASSGTMHAAVTAARRRERRGASGWLLITMGLGVAFLAIKAHEVSASGFGVDSHAYGTIVFTMLGAHAVHLLGGIGLLGVLLFRLARTRFVADRGVPEAAGYYWHFVDVLWLAIFATIYLLR